LLEQGKSEDDVMRNWDRSAPVLASIVCTTYNHGRYIEQALDGFLIQETSFPFEIVIHDDLSTDDTRDIVDKYAARYPRIIRTIYQTENQYTRGRTSSLIAFAQCRARYIAFCEGDDYWTDAHKLQLQCDFLERETSYSLVFHNAYLQHESRDDARDEIACLFDRNTFTLEDVILDGWFIPSHSMVFRRESLELQDWLHHVFGLDYVMHLLLACNGKIGYLDRVMGVYRINGSSMSANKKAGFFQVKHIQSLSYFDFHTGFVHAKLIARRLDREREAMYLAYLNGSAWVVKALSLDYYRFKLGNFLRRRKRRVAAPAPPVREPN
jgi:glycosyltransferase involved in cell wall biosynthesis